ncbi:hypothetical protein EDB85DRAFT_703367 [Lactarius pseudohatsudake]|nr:hypothetical protein EDB85DRAFT_703367 [Lactarius pseudohatsudake]
MGQPGISARQLVLRLRDNHEHLNNLTPAQVGQRQRRERERQRGGVAVQLSDSNEVEDDSTLTAAQRAQHARQRREREASDASRAPGNSSPGQHGRHVQRQNRRRTRRQTPYQNEHEQVNRESRSRTYRVACRLPISDDIVEHFLGPCTVQCRHCHALHWLAEKRGKSPKRNPQFAECCRDGDVVVELLDRIPASLRTLYEGSHRQAIEFRRNI